MKITICLISFCAALMAQNEKDVFLDKCAVCHAADGSASNAKGRKLKMKGVKDTVAKVSAGDMIKIVTDGKGEMPAFGKELGKEQVKALVEYHRGMPK